MQAVKRPENRLKSERKSPTQISTYIEKTDGKYKENPSCAAGL